MMWRPRLREKRDMRVMRLNVSLGAAKTSSQIARAGTRSRSREEYYDHR
jgi:hypothetical protein